MNEWNKIAQFDLLTPENAVFSRTENGILQIRLQNGNYDGRAYLSLNFPFQTKEKYISVLDEEKNEIGMISSVSDFDEAVQEILREEIRMKYFAPKILKITKLTERFGFSYWDCETDLGPLSFAVKDTYRSMIRVSDDRIFIVDSDGCRYEIESLKALDKKSYSKLELYI